MTQLVLRLRPPPVPMSDFGGLDVEAIEAAFIWRDENGPQQYLRTLRAFGSAWLFSRRAADFLQSRDVVRKSSLQVHSGIEEHFNANVILVRTAGSHLDSVHVTPAQKSAV